MRLPLISCLFFFVGTVVSVSAQNDYLFPFSLQASIGENPSYPPDLSGGLAARCALYPKNIAELALGVLCHSAFIKENGLYGLGSAYGKGKDNWRLSYSYQGYSAWHRQQIALEYSRNILPGLGLGIFTACRTTNRIEDRKAGILLDIGLSFAFKRGIWAAAFEAGQCVPLRSHQKKEWNHALFLRIGTACNLYKNLHVGIDFYKDLRYPLQGGISFSYAVETARSKPPPFLIYAQARINPAAYKIGFAYTGRRIHAEISVAYQHPIGFETCVGIAVKHLFIRKP